MKQTKPGGAKVSYPAVYVGEQQFSINKKFAALLGDAPCVRIRMTSDYLFFSPAEAGAPRTSRLTRGDRSLTCCIPSWVKATKLRRGVYRVYKTTLGYAIKRYDPLEGEA